MNVSAIVPFQRGVPVLGTDDAQTLSCRLALEDAMQSPRTQARHAVTVLCTVSQLSLLRKLCLPNRRLPCNRPQPQPPHMSLALSRMAASGAQCQPHPSSPASTSRRCLTSLPNTARQKSPSRLTRANSTSHSPASTGAAGIRRRRLR